MPASPVPPDPALRGKRGFLKGLLGLSAAATIIPIHAEATGLSGQPPRRPGMPGKRYGMVVDLRKCTAADYDTAKAEVLKKLTS